MEHQSLAAPTRQATIDTDPDGRRARNMLFERDRLMTQQRIDELLATAESIHRGRAPTDGDQLPAASRTDDGVVGRARRSVGRRLIRVGRAIAGRSVELTPSDPCADATA